MTYTVTVLKGKRAGKVRNFSSLIKAHNWADKIDLEYGAICTIVNHIKTH